MRYYKVNLKHKHPRLKTPLELYHETNDDKTAAWVAEYFTRTDGFKAWDVLKVTEVTKEEALKNV